MGLLLVASGGSLAGVAGESPAAFGLALPGFAIRPPAAVWLNRGAVTRARALEVGMPTVVPLETATDKGSPPRSVRQLERVALILEVAQCSRLS